MRRFMILSLLALALVAGGCGDDDDGESPSPTAGDEPTMPAGETPAEPTDTPAEDPETPTESEEPTADETAEPTEGEPAFEGTLDPTTGGGSQQGPAQTLSDVRIGEQEEGYDRIVFEFEGDSLPAYQVEYVVPPVVQCGSGQNVELAGGAALQVSMRPAQAHDEAGETTIPATELTPGYPAILEAEQTCDFEAAVTWAVGIPDQTGYRVEELTEPTRLVIDILH